METAEESTLKAWLRKKNSDGLSPLFEAMLNPGVPLKVVRTLLDKGANLGSFRWAQLGLFRITQKQTARQFALESGRRDLIALVKEYDRKLRVRSA
jgi:ankyrin repeat protein